MARASSRNISFFFMAISLRLGEELPRSKVQDTAKSGAMIESNASGGR
jgi:hypothetical protein